MTLQVIGTGFGRTGTMSLRMALEKLGADPCYHMEWVLRDMARRVPHWQAALAGRPDWATTFDGFRAAVDWPTVGFWRDLVAQYPDARIIHTTRSAESWYESFSQTILAVLTSPERWPETQRDWLGMVREVVLERSLGGNTDRDGLIAAFEAHEAAVRAEIPAERLLVFHVADGWEPLAAFLDAPVPPEPFPRSNAREEFFALLAQSG